MCTDQLLVKESNIENLRIYKTADTNRPRVSESIKLLIQIDRGCVIKRIMSESIKLLLKNRCVIECHNERIVAVRIRDT